MTDLYPQHAPPYVTLVSCSECDGSGQHSNCEGEGYVPDETITISQSGYTQTWAPCGCDRGRCPECAGTGNVLEGRMEL